MFVHVQPDDRFVREGNDIVSAVELTMTQAASGASLQVETLDGELALDFEPGAQPGCPRLRGKGMPVLQGRGRGDHRVLIDVRSIPAHLTDEQRRLLEDFGRSEHERNYGTDVGLLREAALRVPLSGLRRLAVTVPAARAEEARAGGDDRALPRGVRGAGCRRASRACRLHGARRRGRRARGALGPVQDLEVARGWEDERQRFHCPWVGPLWIGPSWELPDAEMLAVVVDPGRAFGTGAHATTRLSLELLLEPEPGGLVDVGCGSACSPSLRRSSVSHR